LPVNISSMGCPSASTQPVCPSHPLSSRRRSDRLRLSPSQNAGVRESRPWFSDIFTANRPSHDHFVFRRENIIDGRLAIRKKTWPQSGYRARPFQSARPVGEIGRVEGKVGRADFVDSAGIAFPQFRKKSQQDRPVILLRRSILLIHVLPLLSFRKCA
jgi:hypothetical protein